MTTIALYSNKGGVGKTAAAVNLGYLAAESGRTTLVCDLDPQASATFYFRIKPKLSGKAKKLAGNPSAMEASIKGSDFDGLDLLPADFTHRDLDVRYSQMKRSKHKLADALQPLQMEYDLVILDCPPSIGLLAENIFHASDFLLTPLIPTTLSLRTHEQVQAFLADRGHDLARLYTFFSMVDRRKKLHRETIAQVTAAYANILPSPIPYSSMIEQMGVYRQPVLAFAPASAAAAAYRELWQDISAQLLSR
jgi:chromosome partitioning protein